MFSKGVSFFQAEFNECVVSFDGSTFAGGGAFFGGAKFRDFNLFFRGAKFSGGRVYFGGGTFERVNLELGGNLGNVWFNDAEFCGSDVEFRSFQVVGPVGIELDSVTVTAGQVDLSGLRLNSSQQDGPTLLVAPKKAAEGLLKMPPSSSVQLELDFPS